MLHLNPDAKGRYIKLNGKFFKLDRITKADKDGGELKVTHKGQTITVSGPLVDEIRKTLRAEGKPGKD